MLSNNDFIFFFIDSTIFQTFLSFVCYRIMILSFIVDSAIFQTVFEVFTLSVIVR